MKKSDLTKLIAIGAAVTAAGAPTAVVFLKHRKHKTMLAEHTKTLTKKQAYITGGGLSAFASALYLVRDWVSLRRIFIYLQTALATAATTKQVLSAVAEKL